MSFAERESPLSKRPVTPRDEFLVFGLPAIGEDEINEVVDTLRSGWIGFGPKCIRFEQEFAAYVGSADAISLNSCTAGLHLALKAAEVGSGDEVITSPLTFAATVNVIEHVGATPIFVDVEWASQNIDVERIEAVVTPRTRAIIPVHMAGRPCNMDAVAKLAERHGLIVIEDAAHAIGAAWKGQKIGSFSHATVFSFYATKNLTTAEGGMLTTNDPVLAERVRMLRLHGITKDAWKRYSAEGFTPYDTVMPGFKYNMTDMQASIGIHQLARVERNLAVREKIWSWYDDAFAQIDAVEIPAAALSEERHARHLYTLMLNLDQLRIGRSRFIEELRQRNIGAGIHFVPVHLHSYYRDKYGLPYGSFPVAEAIGDRTVSLPLSPALTQADVEDVVNAVADVVQQNHG
jgi:dTDP-4-amino-4,6-dideoxygalactose transaminase